MILKDFQLARVKYKSILSSWSTTLIQILHQLRINTTTSYVKLFPGLKEHQSMQFISIWERNVIIFEESWDFSVKNEIWYDTSKKKVIYIKKCKENHVDYQKNCAFIDEANFNLYIMWNRAWTSKNQLTKVKVPTRGGVQVLLVLSTYVREIRVYIRKERLPEHPSL